MLFALLMLFATGWKHGNHKCVLRLTKHLTVITIHQHFLPQSKHAFRSEVNWLLLNCPQHNTHSLVFNTPKQHGHSYFFDLSDKECSLKQQNEIISVLERSEFALFTCNNVTDPGKVRVGKKRIILINKEILIMQNFVWVFATRGGRSP